MNRKLEKVDPQKFDRIPEAKLLLGSNVLHHHFYLPEVDIQVQNGHGASAG